LHSIKNISERNKIDNQSRDVAYIMIKSLDAPKSILVTEKTLKTPSSGQICKKTNKKKQKTKKPQKPEKPKKTKKNPTGLVFFIRKPGFFPTLPPDGGPA
jgi:hypothetical protein